MNYSEAVEVIAKCTNDVHDEQCFETGHCNFREQSAKARRRAQTDSSLSVKQIDAAEKVIAAHLEQYDKGQITPGIVKR